MKLIRYFFVLILLFTVGCASGEKEKKNEEKSNSGVYEGKVRVGHLVALDMAPLFIAKENGYFKEEGLDVETVFFSNPGNNNAALESGDLQFSINPFTLHYLGANSNAPMRIISSAGGLGIIEVVVQGEYGINNLDEFIAWIKANPDKKMKIAVLKGDTLEMIVQKMLADNGLSYEDVEMVWFSDLLAMVQAFESKEVDVLSHIKPYTTNLIVNHDAKSLGNNSDIWGYGTPNCTVAVLEEFMKKYPATVKSYLKATKKGFEFIVNEPEKSAEILTKGNYYKVSQDVLKYAFENQPKEVILKPNKEGMMMAINALIAMGYMENVKDDIVVEKYLTEINAK